jgi:DNA replication protein DnaC
MTFKETHRRWDAAFNPPLVLPERFANATPTELPEALRYWVRLYLTHFWERADQGIAPAFLGKARQWKTYAAAVIARWVHYNRVDTEWVECGPEFTRLDSLFFEEEGRRQIDHLSTVPFLVLDDFTQVPAGTRAAQLMAAVAQARFSAALPTLWTGNRALPNNDAYLALVKDYGACLTRRILDGSQGYRVDMV